MPKPESISLSLSDPKSSKEDGKKENNLISRPIISNIPDRLEADQYEPSPRHKMPMRPALQPPKYYLRVYQSVYDQRQPIYSQYQPYQNHFGPNEYYPNYEYNRLYQEVQNDGY